MTKATNFRKMTLLATGLTNTRTGTCQLSFEIGNISFIMSCKKCHQNLFLTNEYSFFKINKFTPEVNPIKIIVSFIGLITGNQSGTWYLLGLATNGKMYQLYGSTCFIDLA